MIATEAELRAQVQKAEAASIEVHAAVLRLDSEVGALRAMVQEIELDRFENRVVFDGLKLLSGEVTTDYEVVADRVKVGGFAFLVPSDEIEPDSRHHEVAAS